MQIFRFFISISRSQGIYPAWQPDAGAIPCVGPAWRCSRGPVWMSRWKIQSSDNSV